MHIAIISPFHPLRGGIAQYTMLLLQTLRQRGHRVSLINYRRQYPNFLFPGTTQFADGPPPVNYPAPALVDTLNPISWLRTGFYLHRLQPDVIVAIYWMPFLAPALGTIGYLARGSKIKTIGLCHNIIPHEAQPGSILLSHYFLSAMSANVVLSRVVEQELKTLLPGRPCQRIHHPLLTLFPTRLTPAQARQQLGIPSQQPLLLFFGYVRPYKGVDLLICALPQVKDLFPEVQLLVVGEFYESEAKYHDLIEKNRLEQSVTLLNRYVPVEEVEIYFQAADAVVLPYLSASQSGIIQIAYHFNKPVVTTPVGGLPEFVEPDKTGIIIEKTTADSLAAGIIRLLSLRSKVDFAHHIKIFKQQFSWQRQAEAIEELADPQVTTEPAKD